jgi:stage III sporulation protein AH
MKKEKISKILSSKLTKSLAVFIAVLLIGAAVFVNYKLFYDPVDAMGYGDGNMENNFGSSTETGSNAENENYLTATALNRQQSRDEEIDVLKLVSESEESSEEAKAEATAKIAKIAEDMQNESNIETLVKAKGFEECVAIISDNSVSVIVGAEALQASEAAQILAIVYDTTGISPENVSIINKNVAGA